MVYLTHVSEEIHDMAPEFILLSPYLFYVNMCEAVLTELEAILIPASH